MKRLGVFAAVSLVLAFLAPSVFGCIMFTKTERGTVLVGNNEDSKYTETVARFVPGKNGKYGAVYFGYSSLYPQGGMNEKGLVYDGLACDEKEVKDQEGKKKFDGILTQKVMEECATVDEVITLLEQYDLSDLSRAQLMFVDRRGESVIVEGDTMLRKRGTFQVATNFYLSTLKKGEPIPCIRYKIASDLLRKNDVTVDAFREILAQTHQEAKWADTQYSNIYDPERLLVYLYHFHNYENEVVIDLKKELRKGEHIVKIADLFPVTAAYANALQEKERTFARLMDKLIRTKGIETAEAFFQAGMESPGDIAQYEVNKREINQVGYAFLKEKKYPEAIAMFTMFTRLFPGHANAWDSLGEAYFLSGDLVKALENYKIALKLDPSSKNAAEYIEKIEAALAR
ncbi:MAG TPA: tetratricopeptide repeat protein [Candidatus Mcinerneyibacteriales bacterium]|nr:tetratricopeptide repeat protein [Candidatus Mcinerneyibacteriales bacterium]HPQ90058.1 tetratricopeptide repeat protein [Candidatus Mcinerneyibacteriales bacterium]